MTGVIPGGGAMEGRQLIPLILCLLAVVPTIQTQDSYFNVFSPKGDLSYNYTWLLTDQPSILFEIMTCHGGSLMLTQTPQDVSKDAYKVTIDKNVMKFTRVSDGLDVKTFATPDDYLNCQTYRKLWLSWENRRLRLGGGYIIGESTFLDYDGTIDDILVTGLSLASSTLSDASWKMERKHVQTSFVHTTKGINARRFSMTDYTRSYFVYGVRSCHGAKFDLSPETGGDAATYTIHLSQGGVSSIYTSKMILAQAQTPGLLHCDITNWFWVRWINGSIEVGRGMTVGDEIFMRTFKSVSTENLHQISIQSDVVSNEAFFQIRNFEVNSFRLLAVDNLADSKAYRLQVTSWNAFVFRVRACKDATIQLKRDPTNLGDNPPFVRFTIGGVDNTETMIDYLDGNGGIITGGSTETVNVLSCNEMRQFWLSWKGEIFRLGHGSIPFQDEIVNLSDKYPPNIPEWLQLISQDEVDFIDWQFDHNQGASLIIPTSLDAQFLSQASYTVSGMMSLVFKVKGKKGARLSLGQYLAYNVGNTYQVVLGGEKDGVIYSEISKSGEPDNGVSVNTPDVLSATVWHSFWVEWSAGRVEVGRETVVGEGGFLTIPADKDYEVNAVHLTGDLDITWKLNSIEVERYSIQTRDEGSIASYSNVWLSSHLNLFPFMVKAGFEVSVVLTKTPGKASDGDVEIQYGIDDNTATGVMVRGDTSSFKQITTDNILSAFEFRPLWFIYYNRTLRIGAGHIWGQNILMTYETKEPIDATGVILNNAMKTPAEWSILPETVNVVRKKTPAIYGHRQIWRTVASTSSFVFKVKAANSAHILLSPAIHQTAPDVIEVTIGDEGNSKVTIRNGTKDSSGEILKWISLEALDEFNFRSFWISWWNGEIRLGRGSNPMFEMTVLIDYTLFDPIPIHAVSFCTSESIGEWEVSEIVRDLYYISTPPSDSPSKFGYVNIYTTKAFLQFGVVSCTSARVFMYGGILAGASTFEIVIGENITDTVILYSPSASGGPDKELARSSAPGVFRCGVEHVYWLSWEDKLLGMGIGNYPNNILFEYTHTAPIAFQFLALGSGTDGLPTPTQWQLRPKTVSRLLYKSKGPRNYDQFFIASTAYDHMRFSLQTKGDVGIVLCTTPKVTHLDAYELLIRKEDDKHRLVIQKDGVTKKNITVKSLDLSEVSTLWLSWRYDAIEFGHGARVGSGKLIGWTDTDPLDISFFAMSSLDEGTSDWGFFDGQETLVEFHSPDSNISALSYNRVFFAPANGLTAITFHVQACKNVRFALATHPGDFSRNTYEILLEWTDETTGSVNSYIRAGVGGATMDSHQESGIVTCNEIKDFWFDWFGGIAVGKNQIYSQEFLHYTTLPIWSFRPNVVAFATGPGSEGDWAFPLEQAEVVFVNISGDPSPLFVKDYFWVGVMDRTSIVFTVKLEKHAIVLVSELAFQGKEYAYEFEIQRNDGYTVLKKTAGLGGKEIEKVQRPNLLSESEFRAFWVSWENHTLALGQGGLINSGTLISHDVYEEMDGHTFASVGVAKGVNKGGGEYSFLRSRGKVYYTHTEAKEAYGQVFLISGRQEVTFKVRTCTSASVLLVGGMDDLFRDTLEIIIGAYTTKIEIRYFTKSDPVAEVDVGAGRLMDCKESRSFWVSWSEGVIRVGSGTDLSRDLLSWVFREPDTGVPAPFVITGLTVATVVADGQWEIDFYQPKMAKIVPAVEDGASKYAKSDTDETFVVRTDKQYHYDQHWVGVPGETSFVFMVQASHEVHLLLAAIPLNKNTMAYEIGIGTSYNRKSIIRDRPGALVSPVKEADTPNILDKDKFRPFWVSWFDGEVAVGRGIEVGLDPFIRWTPTTQMHVVNSIGIATGGGDEGLWFIGNLDIVPSFTPPDDKYLVQTPEDGNFLTHFIPANDFLMFGVKACSDARIKLNAVPSYDDKEIVKTGYTVTIGEAGNTKSSIHPTGTSDGQVKSTPSVLHCNATRNFWVTWRAQTISLGQARTPVGETPLVSYFIREMPDMHSVSIATSQHVTGNWEISRSQTFYCHTMNQPLSAPTFEEFWISINVAKEMVFSIKACNDAQIHFTNEKRETKNSYYVQLGHDFNTVSTMRKGKLDGSILNQVITPGILSCTELRYFWAQWYQGLVVGRGRVPGIARFLKSHDTVYPVGSVGFSGYYATQATFQFQDIDDESIYALTPGDNTYQHVWVSTARTAFTFKVKSCSGAVVRLSPSLLDSDPNKFAYEVILENGVTVIRRFPGPFTMKNATTPELVTCHIFAELSLSWANGNIILSQAGKPILSASDPWEALPVKAITLGAINYGRYGAEWKFPRHLGRDTVIITPDTQTEYTKWMTTAGDSIVFRLRVESNALIKLCQFVGVLGFDCYVIAIQDKNTATGACSTYIQTFSGGNITDKLDGCDFVDNSKSAQFWVSWKNSLIQLGVGSEVGYHSILTWDASEDQFEHPVNAITMLTYQHTGYWEFSQIEDRYFELKTPKRENGSLYYYSWLRMADNFLSFRLKGCEEAVLLLAETPNDRNSSRYEILMGEKSHVYKVQKDGAKVILGQYDTPGLLDCDNYKQYSLQWSLPILDMQTIVLSEEIGDNVIMISDELSRFKVHAISFAGGPAKQAWWLFKDDAAAVTSFETPGDKDTEQIVYKLSHSSVFTFKLKGKGPAHVVLQEHYHQSNVYEIGIGLEDNMKTGIKKASNTKYDAIEDTPNILSEVDLRHFWITWSGSKIAFGRGIVPGLGEIVQKKDNDLKTISMQYIALTTSLGSNGTWEVTSYEPDVVLPSLWGQSGVNPEVSYLLAGRQTGAVFKVRTCSNFTVSLHPQVNAPSAAYKVEYRTRVLYVYRHNSKVHSVTLQEDLQTCSRWAVYWIGWQDGYIELAVGSQLGRRVIWWQDDDPLSVHVLKVPNDGQVSQWSFPRYLASGVIAKQAKVTTGVHVPFRNLWYSLTGRRELVFAIRSVTGGSVLFTRTPGVATHDGYELRLSNVNTTLHNRLTGEVVLTVPSPAIINSAEFNYFWCTWNNGLLQVGKGVLASTGQIVVYQMEPGYDVVAASFDHNDLVEWSFTQDSGNEFILTTPKEAPFDHAWFAPQGDSFTFSVKSGRNAIVRLFNQPEYTEPYYIDLAFGYLDNMYFYMFENGEKKVSVLNRGRLDANNYRTFWLSTGGGRIRVGEGPYLENQFVNEQLTWEISSIAFGHNGRDPASWKIPQDQEYMARLRTPGDGQFSSHWVTLVGHYHFVFRVKACDSVKILLVSTLQNQVAPASEIGIDNELSYIITGAVKHTKATTDMLSCTEYRTFWVRWHKSIMEFGKGATINRHTVLSYHHDALHMVVAMTLASAVGNETYTATWDIYRLKGDVLYETAKAGKSFKGVQIRPSDRSWFTVDASVRTCEQAEIGLFTFEADETSSLTVVYGSDGNTMSEIIKGDQAVDMAVTPYLMNEKVYIPVWVNWFLSNVKSGLGRYPELPMLQYKDPHNSKFDFVGFSAGKNCDAHWAIEMRGGDKVYLETPSSFTKGGTTLSLLDVSHLFLKIQAKRAAHIALSVLPNNLKTLTYEIVIQEIFSGKTCLRKGVAGELVTCVKKDHLLDGDEARNFWITWDKLTLAFGTGWEPSEETRILYTMDNLLPPFALVSFASGTTDSAIWEIQLTNSTSDTDNGTSTTVTTQKPTGSVSTSTVTSSRGSTTKRTTTTDSGGIGSTKTTMPSTTTSDKGVVEQGGLGAGAIVGIVFGVLLGVMLLCFIGFVVFRRLRPDAKLPPMPSFRRRMPQLRNPLSAMGLFPNPSYQDVVNAHEDMELEGNDKDDKDDEMDA